MAVELEKGFVVLFFFRLIIESPAVPDMAELSVLVGLAVPETKDFALLFQFSPSVCVDMVVLVQWRNEFISMGRTALGEFWRTSEL